MNVVGSQSMIAPLRRVIVKRPEEAFVNQQRIEDQWRDLNYSAPPELRKACDEHTRLVSILKNAGAEVLFLPEDSGTGLDSIYTHDPALATNEGVIIFQTGKPQRRGEGPAMAASLRKWDIPVLGTIAGDATAEGGDMIWLDQNTLIVARSFRTNDAALFALRSLLQPLGVQIVSVDLPYWSGPGDVFHLMSFLSLLDEDLAVVYRKLMPVSLFEMLAGRGIRMVDTPDEEFQTQGCNVLALAPRNVLMLRGNPVTRDRLLEAGCRVEEFDGYEISGKGAGGPTCLTRPLLRE